MSNHWIAWTCATCKRETLVQWVVEPNWPSGLLHRRIGFCEACFAAVRPQYHLPGDIEYHPGLGALADALAERALAHVPTMECRPKEAFATLGLSEQAAGNAARLYGEIRQARASGKKKRLELVPRLAHELGVWCMTSECTLLGDDERAILPPPITKPTARREETDFGRDESGGPRLPPEQLLHGEHGVYFVVDEDVQIVLPPDDGDGELRDEDFEDVE